MSPEEFAQIFKLNEKQIKQFDQYFKLLVEWNEKINLTAITEEKEVYLKHFYDSCAPIILEILENKDEALLDIGAGAGFPSLPMKIIFPELKVTIIDSLAKRINFLDNLCKELELDNVSLLHGRAEDFAHQEEYRESFDWVTARAVARLNVLTELTLPYLKQGGKLLSFKAAKFAEEKAEAANAIKLLGGKIALSYDYALPNGDERHLIEIEKVHKTAKKYPRKAGTPNKQPL